MPDETIANLDLTNCSRPYDFFERIHKAFGFEECGHNWDAIYDFVCTEEPVETLYITGESTVSSELLEYVTMLRTVLDDVTNINRTSSAYPLPALSCADPRRPALCRAAFFACRGFIRRPDVV